MAGVLELGAGAAPATPAAGIASVFVDSADRRLKVVDEKGVVSSIINAEDVNYIRNSGMWFCQRQGVAATNCGSTTLRAAGSLSGLDGWGAWNENANTTAARTDTASSPETGLQSRFYGTFLKVTSTGKFFVSQMLEGSSSCDLRGRTVRFQAWMKGTANQTVRLGLVQLTSAGTIDALPATFISAAGANSTDPTLGTNLAYIAPKSASGLVGDNCTISGNAFNCSATTAWQRFGGVFDVPTTAKNLLVCLWTDAQLVATAGFSISQLSLTDGYEIQDWDPMPAAAELMRVQRIYCKTFNVDTLPAASAGAGTGEVRVCSPVTASTAFGVAVPWAFPTRMRAAPGTVTGFNPRAAGAQVANLTLSTDCTATSVSANGETGLFFGATTPGSTVQGANVLGIHLTADAAGSNNEFA